MVTGFILSGMSIPRSLLRYLVCPMPVAVSAAVSAATAQRRLAAALFLIPRSLLQRRFNSSSAPWPPTGQFRLYGEDPDFAPASPCRCQSRPPRTAQARMPGISARSLSARCGSLSPSAICTSKGTILMRCQMATSWPRIAGLWLAARKIRRCLSQVEGDGPDRAPGGSLSRLHGGVVAIQGARAQGEDHRSGPCVCGRGVKGAGGGGKGV